MDGKMSITITAEKRSSQTRGYLHKLRKRGRVPAVLYGKGISPTMLHVGEGDARKLAESKGFVDLNVDGQAFQVMVRDIQKDPIKSKLLHIDFFKVEMNQPVDAEVPLVLVGEAPGVKAGGILEQPVRMVEIRSLPANMPNELELNIDSLEVGDSITLEALELPEGVELLTDRKTVVASIVPPATGEVEVEETTEESEATETSESSS
jgi:large subunit ribosomal protein L25